MKQLCLSRFSSLLKQVRTEAISLRRRFISYIISAVAMVLSLVLLLLSIFGILNPTKSQILDELDTQLSAYADHIVKDYDKIAAYAISFSEQMGSEIHDYLAQENLTFKDLKDNTEALTELQVRLYSTVYLHMQLAPSSGAFYILDTTVNSSSETPFFNGIYLKYINLSSESTVNNKIALYRGSYTTGKRAKLTFHSGWRNEIRTEFFESCNAEFDDGRYYVLSPVMDISETWEQARYLYVPIRDTRGTIIGVCGFEISNLFFQLSQNVSECANSHLVFGLLDQQNGRYSGQFSSSRYRISEDALFQMSRSQGITNFTFDSESCIGATRTIELGGDPFTATLMIPEVLYNDMVTRGQLRTIGIIAIVVLFTFGCCTIMSKKYVAPILRKIDAVTSNGEADGTLRIREIDDLFTYLEERDLQHDQQLKLLEEARAKAELEAEKTRLAYEKALEEYELAQKQIQQLSREQKKDIVLEDYEFFVCNLATLTPTEYRIYELYLEGKTAAEIAGIIGITDNTMKYHNKNIYSKLGISSRKQLLRFAALKQHQDRKEVVSK